MFMKEKGGPLPDKANDKITMEWQQCPLGTHIRFVRCVGCLCSSATTVPLHKEGQWWGLQHCRVTEMRRHVPSHACLQSTFMHILLL